MQVALQEAGPEQIWALLGAVREAGLGRAQVAQLTAVRQAQQALGRVRAPLPGHRARVGEAQLADRQFPHRKTSRTYPANRLSWNLAHGPAKGG